MNQISNIDFDQVQKNFDDRFTEAILPWCEMCKMHPTSAQGYVQAAYVYLDHRKYKQAEAICIEGMSNCASPNKSLKVCFADIKTWQMKYS